MSLSRCTRCGASCAVGLAACPQCEGTQFADSSVPLAWTCQSTECRAQWRLRLLECPRCRGTEMRLEEITLPHITVHGGPNIPGEPAHDEAPAGQPAAEVPAAPAVAETAPPAAETPADAAARPSVNAPKAAWVEHVAASGLDREQAEAMTKAALTAWNPAPAADGAVSQVTITADADVTKAGL